MVWEVLTLCIDQCGIQLAQALWEQYCDEHQIDRQGTNTKHQSSLCFYEETVLDNMYHVI